MSRPGFDEAVLAAAHAVCPNPDADYIEDARLAVEAAYPIIKAAVLAEVQDQGRLK